MLTITFSNPNATLATLGAALTDTFPIAPGPLTATATPNLTSTCGGTPASSTATSLTLPVGATIPVGNAGTPGTCTVSINVTSSTPGTATNTIAAGSLQTDNGNNAAAATAPLTVTAAAPTLSLQKALGSNRIAAADQFTVEVLNGATVVNATTNSTTTGSTNVVTAGSGATGTYSATAGTAYTLNEAMGPAAGSSLLTQYSQAVSCTNTGPTVVTSFTTLPVSVTPVAGDAIVCTVTNTANNPTLQLNKTFAVNSTAGHTISATTTGGTNPATIAAIATAAGNTTNGTAVTVSVGNTILLPVETFGGGATVSDYFSTVTCNNTATPLTNAVLPASFTVVVADTAIACTYTNTPKSILGTTKVLQNINGVAAAPGATVKAGDVLDYQISVTNTGGSSGSTTLTDTVPANTVFSNAAPSLGWSCVNGAPSGTACTQTVTVAVGATTLLGYRVTVVNPLPVDTTTVANSVTTSFGTCSSCSVSNPTAAVLDTAKALDKVNGVVTSGTATVVGGDVFLYNIVVRNTGGVSGTTVLSETVPTNTTYTGSGEGWSCGTGSPAGTVCTVSVTTAPGSVTTPFTVTVINPLPSGTTTVLNTVTTSAGTCSACTVTTPGTNLDVSGRVFNDNGLGGGTANDGLINGAEVGLSLVGIKLTNCAGTTLATTITDGTGRFKIGVSSSLTVGSPLCVEETNLGSSVSTGASVGSTALPSGAAMSVGGTNYTYTRSGTPDRIAFAWNGTGHAGLNFGDVERNTFVADGAKTGQPGNTVMYAHTFTAQTGGSVSFGIASAVAAPVLAGWSEKIFADVPCSGVLQAGAALMFPPSVATTVVAGQQLCVIIQEFIPATALNGYVNTVKVQADFTFTNAAPGLSASYQATDVTTVGSGALALSKQVRNFTQGAVFGINNQAKSGETLEYSITYTNNGAAPITNLVINDTTPAYTTFISALDGTRPASLSACQKTTPANALPAATVACAAAQAVGGTGAISFQFTGPLNPGGTGNLLFQVKVD